MMNKKALVGILIFSLILSSLVSPGTAFSETRETKTEIRCDFPGRMIEAGDAATFDLEIVNHGPTATYDLLSWPYGDVNGWDINFRDDSSENVYKIRIPEGESRTVTLQVDSAGDTKEGECRIRVCAGDGTIWLYVMITKTHTGETGTLQATIVNKEGDVVKGAKVDILEKNSVIEGMMTTPEGKVSIEVPKGIYTVSVGKDGYISREVEDVEIHIGRTTVLDIIPLEKETYFADFSVKSALKATMVGITPIFEFELKNIGKIDDTYRLNVQGLPDNWYARYKENIDDTGGISEIFLKPGEEKILYLEFIPPFNVQTEEYNFTGIAESTTRSYQQNLTLTVEGNIDMAAYSPGGYKYDAGKGETVPLEITVSNTGSGATLTNINLEVRASEGWKVSVDPELVTSLDPGEKETFSVTVVPPTDIVAGEYRLDVKVKSDQAELDEEFRIGVTEHSNIALIGVMMLGVVVAGLWYVFRKYGRR